jgi:hypothetical protein
VCNCSCCAKGSNCVLIKETHVQTEDTVSAPLGAETKIEMSLCVAGRGDEERESLCAARR